MALDHEHFMGIALELSREDVPVSLEDDLPNEPQAACFPTGELTPFVARVVAGASIEPYEITARIDGDVAGAVLASTP